MQFLLLVSLCTGLGTTGSPPWVGLEALTLPPARLPVTCYRDKMATFMRRDELPCLSRVSSERSLRTAAVARMRVRGPEVQCERGGVCSVSAWSRVQAEVSLSPAPPSLGLSLLLCFLSPSSDPLTSSHIPLLVGGCPAAVGVTLPLAPPPPCSLTSPTRSFSFQLRPFYNHSIQFLHCRLELCARDTLLCRGLRSPEVTATPKCPPQDDPCTGLSPHPSVPRMLFLRTVTQPLIVTIPAHSDSPIHPSAGHRKSPRPLPPPPVRTERRTQGVGVVAVVGVTLCAFVIGVLLMVGLWFIQSKTARVPPLTSGGSQGLRVLHP